MSETARGHRTMSVFRGYHAAAPAAKDSFRLRGQCADRGVWRPTAGISGLLRILTAERSATTHQLHAIADTDHAALDDPRRDATVPPHRVVAARPEILFHPGTRHTGT